MSGGAYDYQYSVLENYYVGKMYDVELDKMVEDLSNVLYDLEWWQSGDCDEERYRKSLNKFKTKWFGKRDKKLRKLVCDEINKTIDMINKL